MKKNYNSSIPKPLGLIKVENAKNYLRKLNYYQLRPSNFDPSTLKGLVSIDAYQMSPFTGFGMFTFDKQDDPKKLINVLKEFF